VRGGGLAAALAGPCLLAGCDGSPPLPPGDLLIRVTPARAEVAFGEGFPLEVLRVFRRDLEPKPFREASLQPLVVRVLETARRDAGDRIAETMSCEAFAFSAGEVAVPGVVLAAIPHGGGDEVTARSEPFGLVVRPALPPGDASPIELPGDVLDPPAAGIAWRWLVALGAAAVAGAGVLWFVALRRRRAATVPAAPAHQPLPAAAHERALAELTALRARVPADAAGHGEIAAFCDELTRIVRCFLGERFPAATTALTTRELLQVLRGLSVQPQDAATATGAILQPSDLVKFAHAAPEAGAPAALLDAAVRLVAELGMSGTRR
jgi:hypothetical protein